MGFSGKGFRGLGGFGIGWFSRLGGLGCLGVGGGGIGVYKFRGLEVQGLYFLCLRYSSRNTTTTTSTSTSTSTQMIFVSVFVCEILVCRVCKIPVGAFVSLWPLKKTADFWLRGKQNCVCNFVFAASGLDFEALVFKTF